MAEFDLVIKGGTIVDGTRVPRYVGDIGIRDGVVATIGSGKIDPARATKVIDATGRIVAPGVIDPHTHYDAQIFWDPYCTNSGWHGNTTFVVGNCGFGFMPCKVEDRERYLLMMENTEQVPLNAMREALPWNWISFPEWMDAVRRIPKGVNLAAYMPLNSLMIYVMGIEAAKTRGATEAERLEMRRLLNEAMDAGAIGFGFSYLNEHNNHKDIDGSPMPTDSMRLEDAYYLAGVLRERGEGVIQCLCELPPGKASNRNVAEELARVSGRPILMNVIAPYESIAEYHRGLLKWLDDMEDKGLNIYGQAFVNRSWVQYRVVDYDQWSTTSPSFLAFTVAQGAENKAKLAADPEFVRTAVEEYDPHAWEGTGGALETMRLLDAKGAEAYAKYNGQVFGDIARAEGKHVVAVLFEIAAASGALAEIRSTAATGTDPHMAAEVLRHKRVLPGNSDGGAHGKFHSGGQYSTDNIMWLVREEKLLSLEDLHYSLSYLTARALGLANRGALLPGMAADLYIYDFDKIGFDREKYETLNDLPGGEWRRVCRAEGIDWIVVNGEPIFHSGESTGATPGRMLGVGGPELDMRLLDELPIAAE